MSWKKKAQLHEGLPPDATFNVELRYLDEDVRVSLKVARLNFKSFMTKKPIGQTQNIAGRNDIIAAYNDVRTSLIGTSRYSQKDIDGIRSSIINMANTTNRMDFLDKAQKVLDDLHWAVSEKSLFKRLMHEEKSLNERV